jgi:hypothetical protein
MDVQRLAELPSIYLPERTTAINAQVTNTTYAALTMQDGLVTSFGNTEPFGGPSGTDPDFFKLSVFGVGSDGQALGTEVEFFLSDYRSEDDYIIGDWQELDLTPLAGARSLHFNLSSSDVGDFGMNTPAYFALDDLTLAATAIPEPSGVLALLVITSGLVLRRRRSVNP